MPLHYFECSNREYIRGALRLGGDFWTRFECLPLDQGMSFTFLPVGCPSELGARLDEAVLGHFEDLTGFREEEALIQQHLHRCAGNLALFGTNWSDELLSKKGCHLEVRQVHSLPDSYYSRGLLLHGRTVTMQDVSDAIGFAGPFDVAALLETGGEDPVQWIDEKLSQAAFEGIAAATVFLIVEAYRGEGLLFWARDEVLHAMPA